MFEDHELVKQARQLGRASTSQQSAPHTNAEFMAILPYYHVPASDIIPLKIAMFQAYIESWEETHSGWKSPDVDPQNPPKTGLHEGASVLNGFWEGDKWTN